jgi:hypothetical protein
MNASPHHLTAARIGTIRALIMDAFRPNVAAREKWLAVADRTLPQPAATELTDTQLRLLAAASQRGDRDLESPSNLTGGAAGKVVAKLLMVEEIQSRGSCVASRRGRCAHPAHHQARPSGDPGSTTRRPRPRPTNCQRNG